MTEKQRLKLIEKISKRLKRRRDGLPERGRLPKNRIKEEDEVAWGKSIEPTHNDLQDEVSLMNQYNADAFINHE